MTTLARRTHEQSMQEIFIQEMNEIYYEGYAEEIIASDPDKFDWELKEFQGQFSKVN